MKNEFSLMAVRGGLSVLVAVMFLMFMAPSGACQTLATDVYQLTAFANNINPIGSDQLVRIINPGVSGETLCADIYVFDDQQEMVECCSCSISADGLLTLSLKNDLTANSLLGTPPDRGVIKILSSREFAGPCQLLDAENPFVTPNLRAWMSHLELGNGVLALSDVRFDRSILSQPEAFFLPQACRFVTDFGGAKGICQCPTAP
jgi:hypothetical protein